MLEETELYKMLWRVKMAPSDELVWIQSFTTELKNMILKLIKEDQLTAQGIDEAGEVIGYYSYVTELITKGRKQQGDPYNLNDTGAFYRSMFVTPLRDSFVIDADGNKGQDDLFTKYGEGIIGLTDENLQKVVNEIAIKYRAQMEQLFYGSV